MPTLVERFESDYKTAMKSGDRLRIDTIRLVKAAVQRAAMDKRKDSLDDAEVLHVLSQQAKQRRETLAMAKQGNRQDIADQTTKELAIIESYLPQQLSAEALKQLIEEALQTVGTNQGQIMKHVMGKAAGAADGKVVSQLVGERLKRGA
jgi:uncharacterized protein YqeY